MKCPNDGATLTMSERSGVEIDYLAGEIVLLGRLHGVPTPVNEAVQRATHHLVRSGGAPRSLDAATLLPK